MDNQGHLKAAFQTASYDFLREADTQNAFHKLDTLCSLVIQHPHIAAALHDDLPVQEIRLKTATIDSLTEQTYARQILSRDDDVAELDSYPWFLPDYYGAELQFIKDHTSSPAKNIAYIGHGCLSALSLMLFKDMPDCHIDFYDMDPQVTRIANAVLDKLAPEASTSFITADIATLDTDRAYDLAIITNAPLPGLQKRLSPVKASRIFLRSATNAGALLYPAHDEAALSGLYRVEAQKPDELYGIHHMMMLAP